MNNPNLLDGIRLLVYRFATDNRYKNEAIDALLTDLAPLCEYQQVHVALHNVDINKTDMVLFLVTSLADLEQLRNLRFPDSVQKVVAYFFTGTEFSWINDANYRRPYKAHSFFLICADQFTESLIYTSSQKVFDTLCHRTIRNKFADEALSTQIVEYTGINPQSAIAEMKEAGWYFRDSGLNHSDSFAGAIALRFGNRFIINASKTDKYQITSDRVCYVEDYIQSENKVRYVGYFPPSSESLVALRVFQEFTHVNVLLHFHYKHMTYSPKFNAYRTAHYVPYGLMEEADTLVDKLKDTGSFVIANGHGEFVMAENLSDAKATIGYLLALYDLT